MNYPRLFAYVMGVIFIAMGSAIFIESINSLVMGLPKAGTLVMSFITIVIYFNLTFSVIKRYMRKEIGERFSADILTAVIGLMPIIYFVAKLIFIDSAERLDYEYELRIGSIFWGTVMGWYYGKKSGKKLQKQYFDKITKIMESEEVLPEDLQRPHDSLNKN